MLPMPSGGGVSYPTSGVPFYPTSGVPSYPTSGVLTYPTSGVLHASAKGRRAVARILPALFTKGGNNRKYSVNNGFCKEICIKCAEYLHKMEFNA